MISVTAAAKQDDQPPLAEVADGAQHVFQSVRRVRVVDQHGKLPIRRRDDFHAALYALGARERVDRAAQRDRKLPRDAERRQRVMHRKAPGDPEAEVHTVILFANIRLHVIRTQLDVLCKQLRRSGLADGVAAARRAAHHLLRVAVVGVEHTLTAAREEHLLGRAVGVHGFMKIQMILREIGKCADGKVDAVHAVQIQRVGGDLHDHMRAARVAHLRKQRLQVVALRGGVFARQRLFADLVADRADQADPRAERVFQQCFEQIGHGRLAVGSGHADDTHGLRRLTKAVRAEARQCGARGGHADPRRSLRHLLLTDHGGSAAPDRVRNESVAVCNIARDGDEEVTRFYKIGGIADIFDLQLRRSGLFQNIHAAQQLP